MKKCYLSTKLVTLTISLLLITLFAAQATAVKKPRQSNLNGGWQIWIAAVDFDRLGDNRFVKRGKEAGKEGPKPVLAEDVLIGISNRHRVLRAKGAPEYDFTSPHAGDAYIYARVMGLANNRAWFVDLNPAAGDVAYSIIIPILVPFEPILW